MSGTSKFKEVMKMENSNELRFSVYDHKLVYDNDKLLRRQLIVLKNKDGNIVKWTDFHKYARSGKKSLARSIYSGQDKRCATICLFLNYVFFEKYHIKKLTDVKKNMVKDFLNDYGLCRLPGDSASTHRNKDTVIRAIAHTIDFLDLMIEDNPTCQLRTKDLYRNEKVFSKTKKKYIQKKVPIFEINYKPDSKKIFRDIPEGAFQIIMNEIVTNHRNILMLAALSAFAGMRPSECCNVRREDSALGPGILFEVVDGEVTGITIDISEEKNLRSDLVNVGGIKKERRQKVYPAFIEAFMSCYDMYISYINGSPYEAEYGALTNTSVGKAYTYEAYYKEFKNVVKACIPIMLENDDPKTVNYGHLLQENNISPHILRHWFSVKLTLYGEDVAGLMNWRGDKSPESALTYLMNKSELEKQYELVSDEVFNYSLWKAGKLNE